MDSLISEHSKGHPLVQLTYDRKVRCQILRSYYESKINCLMEPGLSPRLALLACWDSQVDRKDLTSEKGRKKFIKKSIKFYKKRLKEIIKLEKKL